MAKRKRRSRPDAWPKSAYRLPNGTYVVAGPWGPPNKRGRRIRVVGLHRAELDAKKVAAALVDVAMREMFERHQHPTTDQPMSKK